MTLDFAIRCSEMLLAWALIVQSVEFIRYQQDLRGLHLTRLVLSVLLLFGVDPLIVETFLLLISVKLVLRFQGPYNGGSDSMTLLVLLCLWLSHLAPNQGWREIALGYLAIQLILSYFQAGWVKLINPEWRSGLALQQVFAFTAYPVSQSVREFSNNPALMLPMSWAVILFEILFPLSIFSETVLYVFLFVAAVFHLANACLFGLNRFFWIWPAAYPVLIWFQGRVV